MLFLLALFGGVFLAHAASPNEMTADSQHAVQVAQSMVRHRTISLDPFVGRMALPEFGVQRVGDHVYPRFPWAPSLFAVPMVAGANAVHAAFGVGPDTDRLLGGGRDWKFQVVSMSLVVAATTVVVFLTAEAALTGVADRRRRRRWALVVALVFAFGTSAWSTASRSLWQHGPSVLCLSVAAWLAVRSRERPDLVRWMGLPLGAAYFMRPTNAVPIAVLSLWVLACRRRQVPAYAAGLAAMGGLFVLVSLRAYRSVVPEYYDPRSLRGSGTFWEALAGNLVSPARGLLVYSPVLGLAAAGLVLRRRRGCLDGLDVALAAVVAGHWVAISRFPHWWGGHSYGPRFFTDMVPFLVVLALPVAGWLATRPPGRAAAAAAAGCAVLALVSVGMHAQGALFRSSWCWNTVPTNVDDNPERIWSWRDAQFLRGLKRVLRSPHPGSEIAYAGKLRFGCGVEEGTTVR